MFTRRIWATTFSVVAVAVAITGCTTTSPSTTAPSADCTPENDITTLKKGVLTVAAAENPPVVVTADGAFEGLEPTLIAAFAKANCLTLDVQPMSFAATIPAIQSGRADLAVGGYYRTAERAEVVSLSAPVWLDQMGIYAKADIDTVGGLEGLQVGTVDGYLWVPELQAVLGDNLTVYPSTLELRADLEAGRIEAAVDSISLAPGYEGFVGVVAEPDDRVQSTIQPAQVGFPFTKDNSSLEAALDAAIAQWHDDGSITAALKAADLPESLGDVGEARLIK